MNFCWQAEKRSSWLLVHFRKSPAVLFGAAALRDGGAHCGRAGGWNEQNKFRFWLSAEKRRWTHKGERGLKKAEVSAFVHVFWRLPPLCVSECLSLSQGWHATIITG